jgi:hypothetical protein
MNDGHQNDLRDMIRKNEINTRAIAERLEALRRQINALRSIPSLKPEGGFFVLVHPSEVRPA